MRELYQPWSAERAEQRWPFRADASLTLPDGRVVEKDLFTSLQLLVPSVDVWISAFGVWGQGYTVEISGESGHVLTGLQVANLFSDEVTLQFLGVEEAKEVMAAGTFDGIPHKGTPLGLGQINTVDGFNLLGVSADRRIEAGRDAFPIDPDCLLLQPSRFGVTLGSRRLTGVAWVVAGDGVIFERAKAEDEDYPGVRVNVQGVSDAEKRRLACEAAGVPPPAVEARYPLRSINGVSPDAAGRLGFRLKTPEEGGTIGTALRLKPTRNGHMFFVAGAT